MSADPALVALAFPVVMLSAMGVAFTLAAMRGPAQLAAMSRRGSSLYLAILVIYTCGALVVTSSDPAQLGLVPAGDAGSWALRTAVLVLVGLGAARLLLLAELEIGLRRLRRADARADGAAEQRALRATASSSFAALAIAFALFEELLWRGVGVREVQALHGGLEEAVLIAAGVVLFGACHVYFGAVAVVSKTVCGAVWCLLTILGAGILPALASHTAYQFHVARWNDGQVRSGGLSAPTIETASS